MRDQVVILLLVVEVEVWPVRRRVSVLARRVDVESRRGGGGDNWDWVLATSSAKMPSDRSS